MTDCGDETVRVAFVCVQNAGRSQMAYAFAQRELEERGLSDSDSGLDSDSASESASDDIEVVTGGTQPAEKVHPEVVDSMRRVGVDVSGRTPREIGFDETQNADTVITMGCSAEDVCPSGWAGDSRDWNLDDPDGRTAEEVDEIRDEIERRIEDLFDELVSG